MNPFLYRNTRTREISFPLGGLGTGCIGLAGNGRLLDWEIFNRPNKGGTNGFSHFAVKAEAGGRVLDARILSGDLGPPYAGSFGERGTFGSGPRREYLSGLPHFREVEFLGEFPIATLSFMDRSFPGRVRMIAFNPFIPLNDKDSGIPGAFFEIAVTNTTRRHITYTICGTLGNPLPASNVNRVRRAGALTSLHLTSNGPNKDDTAYGDLALATDAPQVSWQEYWFRSRPLWFSDLEVFWEDFTGVGKLKNRRYAAERAGEGTDGCLAAHLGLAPGKTGRVRFVISWSFPNCENYWEADARKRAAEAGVPPTWRNYYATQFKDANASAAYALRNWDRLYRETTVFKEALFASSLPPAALEAVSANLSILKTPTVLRLEDGTFYGWEGCDTNSGCCEGTCTHVWNYSQALPFLFPKLERSVREADFRYNQRPDGGMAFRLLLPPGSGRSGFRPCADGQFGGILKTYRDWKISGDSNWLRPLWPAVKKSLEFAWSPENEDRWDPEKTGVLHGRQHHTLDMELFGPNAWLTGFYLAALKAGAEMAEHLGESGDAVEYRDLFERGRRWVDEHLFNGEYYVQLLDLSDRSVTDSFGASETYWDAEHREIKHQIGEGCAVDQVLAQWHANLYGLGSIFDPRHTKRALRAIFQHNFVRPMRDFPNPCRVYCLNDEAGLIICAWPEGRRRPRVPVPYATETMNGFEYAAAAQMIQAGMVKQGMKIVAAVRDRYDGEKRNPWNEFECGSNYARSMASYSLLLALSGFTYSAPEAAIGFAPRLSENDFRTFFCVGSGWGTYRQKLTPRAADISLLIASGGLTIRELHAALPLSDETPLVASVGRQRILARLRRTRAGAVIAFDGPVALSAGETLKVSLRKRLSKRATGRKRAGAKPAR